MKQLAQTLADALLPADVRPYLLFESDDPPAEVRLPQSLGVYGRAGDILARDWLESRGEWRGRGPAVYLNDIAIRELAIEACEGHTTAVAAVEAQLVYAVVCHELAHVAERGIDVAEPTAELVELAHAAAAYSLTRDADITRPPFDGHDWRFVRLALHLSHRAESLGYSFPLVMLFHGESYGIAEPSDFAFVLDGCFEPSHLAGVSIFGINTFAPPTGFVRLWQACVERWIDQQSPDSPAIQVAREHLLVEPDR